jgi:hypothetical protein
MGILGKRGNSPDIIDFTLLQKRGLIKKQRKARDILDLTAGQAVQQSLNEEISKQGSEAGASPLSFLDNLAGASSESGSYFDSENKGELSEEKSAEINTLRVKLEDLEYKLERLMEKFNKIGERLDEFEKKVS